MNERIKELAEQVYGSAHYDDFKFAELIVAECVGIVENLSPGYKDYRDQIEDAFRRDCVIEIKKHFGVEL
jgi:hypothetical protein